jgi:glyoxylase-like metal-dependent hydrolase (beta-lactamase superfamily II)
MTTTYQIGDMTIHRIMESEAPIVSVYDLLPDATPELLDENRAWMEPTALRGDQLILAFNAWVVRTPHHTILVDACIGNHKTIPRPVWNNKTDNVFMTELAAHGLRVEDIDYVMCSHFHPDHIGWNTKLENGQWAPTFPNARYVFNQPELDYWNAKHAESPVAPLVESVLPIIAAGRAEIAPNAFEIGDHVRLMPVPGHTAGHFAVQLGKGFDAAVLAADVMHSPIQARYTHMSNRNDFDRAMSAANRRAFLERYCDAETLCCTAHFPSPSAMRVKRWGDGFKCEMAG